MYFDLCVGLLVYVCSDFYHRGLILIQFLKQQSVVGQAPRIAARYGIGPHVAWGSGAYARNLFLMTRYSFLLGVEYTVWELNVSSPRNKEGLVRTGVH